MRWRTFGAMALFLAAPLAAQPPKDSPAAADRVGAAEQALGALDPERLARDPAYAATIADHVRVMQARGGADEELRFELQQILVIALSGAGRHDAAEAEAEALIAMRPGTAAPYRTAYFVAGFAERFARFPVLLERAADALTVPAERADFVAMLEPEHVSGQIYELRGPDRKDLRVRLAQALLRLGWPGEGKPALQADGLRILVLERHLERSDRAAAARLAAEIRGVGGVLTLVTDRRFDAVNQGDRVARVRAAIAEEDRSTAAALAAAPEDTDAVVHRAAFLRSVGRDREVLQLLLPLMGDPSLVVARHPRGFWLVNEAAFSLIATGALDEAIELMRPLAAMDLARQPDLISTSINFTLMLLQLGRNEEALRESTRLAAAGAEIANDYGNMFVWGNAACAATALGRRAESDQWLLLMEPKAAENPTAMIQARLCRGEMEGAERVLISALESELWREQAILWLQDWDPSTSPPAWQRLRAQFDQLGARPAVQAALARVGHRLRLPLTARTYGF